MAERDFALLWSSASISVFGTGITLVVLPVVVFGMTGSAPLTALLVTMGAAPYLLLGFVAGAVADRVQRLRLMVMCDLLSATAIASVPLAAVWGVLTVGHVFAAATCVGTSFVLFDAASFGVVPAIVGRHQIPRATSLLASTETVIAISAPAIGGLLIAVIDPVTALWVDAGSYVLSSVALSQIRMGRRSTRRALDATPPRLISDIREGLAFIRRNPLIWPLTIAGFGLNLTGGAVVSLLVVFGVRHLGLGPTDPLLGALYAAGEVGSFAAAITLPWLARRYGAPRASIGALALNTVSLFCLAAAPGLISGFVSLFVWWATWTLTNVNGITIRQQLTPDDLQSRVNTSARTIAYGGQPIGAATAAAVSTVLTVQGTYLVAALGVLGAALIGWFSALRRVDRTEYSRLLAEAA